MSATDGIVKNLESKLDVQNSEIPTQSYDYERAKRQQAHLVGEVRDREETHQETIVVKEREREFSKILDFDAVSPHIKTKRYH